MRVKEESKKAGLKLNIQNTKIVTYSRITSWQIERDKVDAVTDSIFSGSKVIADIDWSHEIKRRLLLERKAMTNLDSMLQSRDITLLTKVIQSKLCFFLYGCESWTIKKAEHQRIDAFKMWCWRRLLRVPLDGREIKPEGNQH